MSIFKQTYHKLSDAELVLLYQKKQDQRIMNELFKRNQFVIRTACWKYLQKEDCKDVASDVFEKFIKQIRKEIPRDIGAWIYTVSRNTCLHQVRKKSKIFKVELKEEDSELLSPEYTSLHKEELLICLEEAIKKLGDKQKRCIELFYLKGFSYEDLAKETKEPLKKIKSCLQNGRRNIKIYIDKNLKTKRK